MPNVYSQSNEPDSTLHEIDLVSDTQAPMGIEEIFLKSNHNTLATRKIFQDITQRKPKELLILGDVVSLGYKEKKWKDMDGYLENARTRGIPVTSLLGNHDVMFYPKDGETAFKKRFSDEINTGFTKIIDSIGFVLLNSNFKTLSTEQLLVQQEFYTKTLAQMDADSAVKIIIITCHHAPYSNSKVVGSNKQVQERLVPAFIQSKKAKLFITGHAHDFEHFVVTGKNFLTIGGGGGLHQPLNKGSDRLPSLSFGYDPEFHYVLMRRLNDKLVIISRRLKQDFNGFENGYRFVIN
jgi:Icc-related predicted phosphoesterase